MVVDKSAAIRDIMNHKKSVIVGLCPRRMGKSMFLGLLEDFLTALSHTPYDERRARYKRYAIYQEDPAFFNKNMGHYAVFKLDLKDHVDFLRQLVGGENIDVGAHNIAAVRERLSVHRQYVILMLDMFDRLTKRSLSAALMPNIGDLIPGLMRVFFLLFKRKAVVVVDGCDAPFLNIICGVKNRDLRTQLTKYYSRFLGKIFEVRDVCKLGTALS
ncbi:hypothetical protein IWQ56_000383 [Coemansia nantahalensis]|nr:hypothetical protein IWQ56_000383 [Coemansia nantahalensis]